MKKNRIALAMAGTAIVAMSATGCASLTEPWNDAPVQRKDDGPAVIYSMPDGFANVAAKCDGYGHRMFTTRGGDQGGGKSVAVIADPTCKRR
ncbi:hypothetical protein ACFVZM_06695 [Streptomyces sioyaensis]|uniref:hypothetical protein n=1 Tax=Streptomyces sioyaensis TaxID=67364 RepID=UPI003690CCFB